MFKEFSKKQRFSLRKYTFGVASILLGSFVVAGTNASAEEAVVAEVPVSTTVSQATSVTSNSQVSNNGTLSTTEQTTPKAVVTTSSPEKEAYLTAVKQAEEKLASESAIKRQELVTYGKVSKDTREISRFDAAKGNVSNTLKTNVSENNYNEATAHLNILVSQYETQAANLDKFYTKNEVPVLSNKVTVQIEEAKVAINENEEKLVAVRNEVEELSNNTEISDDANKKNVRKLLERHSAAAGNLKDITNQVEEENKTKNKDLLFLREATKVLSHSLTENRNFVTRLGEKRAELISRKEELAAKTAQEPVKEKGTSVKEEKAEVTRISGPELTQESKLSADETVLLAEKASLESEIENKVKEYKEELAKVGKTSQKLVEELGLVEDREAKKVVSKFTQAESNLRAVVAQVESGEVKLSESILVDLKQGLEQLEAINLQYKTNLANLENVHKTYVVNSKGESVNLKARYVDEVILQEGKKVLEKEISKRTEKYKGEVKKNEAPSKKLAEELAQVEASESVEVGEVVSRFTQAESNLRHILTQVESGEINLSESTVVDLELGLKQLEVFNSQYKANLANLENAHRTYVVNSKGTSAKVEEKPEATRISGPVLMQESKLTANEAELKEKVALEKEVLNKVREYTKELEVDRSASQNLAKELGQVENSEAKKVVSKFNLSESNLRAALTQVETGEVNLSASSVQDLEQGLQQLDNLHSQYKANLEKLPSEHKTYVVNSKVESVKEEIKELVSLQTFNELESVAVGHSEALEQESKLSADETVLLEEKEALEEKISQDVETYKEELFAEEEYLNELLEELKLVNSAEVESVITRFERAETNLRHVLSQVEKGEINLSEATLVDLKLGLQQLEIFNSQYKANVEAVENAHNAYVSKSKGESLKEEEKPAIAIEFNKGSSEKLESLTELDASELLSEKTTLETKITQDVEAYSGELFDEAAYLSELLEELKLVNSAEVESVITRFKQAESNLRHVLDQVESGEINLSETTLAELKYVEKQLETFNLQYKANVEAVENAHNAHVAKSNGDLLKLESLTGLDASGLLSEKAALEEKISQNVKSYKEELVKEEATSSKLLEELKQVGSAELESVITRFTRAEAGLRHVLTQVETGKINLSESTLVELKYVIKQLEAFNLQYKSTLANLESVHKVHVVNSKGESLKQEENPSIEVVSQKGDSVVETKPEVTIASEKGTPLVQEEKSKSEFSIVLAQNVELEELPAVEKFSGNALTQEAKPEAEFSMVLAENLVLEAKPEIKVETTKGTSVVETEKPKSEFSMVLAQNVELEELPAVEKFSGNALTQEAKPESEFSMVLAENLVLEAKPEIKVETTKGTSVVETEKPKSEFSMVLAQNVELEELPAVEKFSGNALTQEAKQELKYINDWNYFVDIDTNEIIYYQPNQRWYHWYDIPGYAYVDTDSWTDSNGITYHTHYFKRVAKVNHHSGTAKVFTVWADEYYNQIIPSRIGSHEAGELEGYEFDRSVSINNGYGIAHVYKKVAVRDVKLKGVSLTQEAKPEAEFSMVLAENLVLEAKPELQLSSKKGEALVQEVKPELKVEKTKGTSLVQETKPEVSLKSNKVSQRNVVEKTRTAPAKKVVKSTTSSRVLPKTSASTQQGDTKQGLILGAASLLAAVTLRRKQK